MSLLNLNEENLTRIVNIQSLTNLHLGFAGVSFASLLGLLQLPALDNHLNAFLICVCICFPINIAFGGAYYIIQNFQTSNLFLVISPIAFVITIFGLQIGLFFLTAHLSYLAAFLFALIGAFSLIGVLIMYIHLFKNRDKNS